MVILFKGAPLFCQNITAFSDYRNYFYLFDNGVSHQQEYQPIKSFKAGGSCLAFVDNMGKFKVYYDGEVREIERYNIGNYTPTEYLLAYKVDQELLVFDNGRIKSLVYYPAFYGVGDSLIAYADRASHYLEVYYKGDIIPIADGLVTAPAKSLRVGDNVVAFVDNENSLYTFYRGKVEKIAYNPGNFNVGLNTVAFVDAGSGEFTICHKGRKYAAETFSPVSYKLGDDMVAYIDQSGSFKLFFKGSLRTISSFEPDFYTVSDNLVIYGENGFFKVIYANEEFTLENYIPQKYFTDKATLAYIDQFGYLQCFYKGVQYSLSDEAVSDILVAGNTVAFKIGLNTNKVFCDGRIH